MGILADKDVQEFIGISCVGANVGVISVQGENNWSFYTDIPTDAKADLINEMDDFDTLHNYM